MKPEMELAGILGLAFKAGQLTPGAEMSLSLIRENKAALALVDPQASANTRKKLEDACAYRGVSVFTLRTGLLGQACGRTGMIAAALKQGNLALRAQKILSTGEPGENQQRIAEDKG